MQWHAQAGNITADLKVKTDFTLSEFIATKFVPEIFMWMKMLRPGTILS